MITQEDISSVEAAATVQEARQAAMDVLFANTKIADRKAAIRSQLASMGTKQQMVQLLWTLMLNKEGLRDQVPLQATKYGLGYKRTMKADEVY